MKNGKGERVYKDGTKLVGTFYNDEFKKGEGTINYGNAKYVGQIGVIDGSTNYGPYGKGKYKFKNGDIYEGTFKNARLQKATNLILSSEDVKWIYKGEVSKSGQIVAEGKGILKTYIKSKPKTYIFEFGNFKNHTLNGKGLQIYYYDKDFTLPRSIYKGEFKMGIMHGRGLYWSNSCDWYHEGNFKNSKYIDDVNKYKKLNKKVFDLIDFAYNLEKK